MALSDREVERFCRQVVIPGIDTAGQERLLRATVVVLGARAGAAQTRLYLSAAGITPSTDLSDEGATCVIVAGARSVPADRRAAVLAAGKPVVWYDVEPERITAGVHIPGRSAPTVLTTTHEGGCVDDTASVPLHHVAACDAVSSAVAMVLDWPIREEAYEVELA